MKNILSFFFVLISFPAFAAAEEKESAYDRVLRTGTIRCAYAIGAPWVSVDPNTGEKSGIMIDVMKEIGLALSLKIDWSGGDVGWGELGTAVESGRGDVICSCIWAAANRGRSIAFTRPLFYTPINVWSRANDTRFDNTPEKINAPEIRVVVDDGDFSESIAKRDFPLAQRIARPQLAGLDFYFLALLDKKADILFISDNNAQDFLKKRPGTIRKVPMPKPLRVYENVLGVDIHEHELRDMMDAAVGDLLASGTLAHILEMHKEAPPDAFLIPVKPYEDAR